MQLVLCNYRQCHTKNLQYGKGTMLAKIDIQRAFRLLPVHLEDRHLLTMSWKGEVYIDHCIPFGLRSAPKLFNILADLLSWATQKAGVSYLIHYLDDYLTIGPPLSQVCQHNLTLLCKDLCFPLTTDKLEGPATSLSFLGIILDTSRMEIRLPTDKLSRTREMIKAWLPRKKATKRELLSLVGTLQRLLKGHYCDAPPMFSMVFHRIVQHHHYSDTPTRSNEHNC